jgi:hypothetical protein
MAPSLPAIEEYSGAIAYFLVRKSAGETPNAPAMMSSVAKVMFRSPRSTAPM